MRFTGKVAFVTGASRGIGRAIAAAFAEDGAHVVLGGRDEEALEKAAQEMRGTNDGVQTEVAIVDVTNPQAVENAIGQTMKTFGRIDFAISNAGQSVDALLLRLKPDVLEGMLSVNLKSAFYLCGAVAKPMIKARSGSIVLISSIVGLSGNAGQSAYAASKAGLLSLSKSLAKELGSRNIRVNAVAPGFIETAMTAALPDTAKQHMLESTALGRLGKPEDVSGVVTFLCSEAAKYVTGQTVVVDGGVLM